MIRVHVTFASTKIIKQQSWESLRIEVLNNKWVCIGRSSGYLFPTRRRRDIVWDENRERLIITKKTCGQNGNVEIGDKNKEHERESKKNLKPICGNVENIFILVIAVEIFSKMDCEVTKRLESMSSRNGVTFSIKTEEKKKIKLNFGTESTFYNVKEHNKMNRLVNECLQVIKIFRIPSDFFPSYWIGWPSQQEAKKNHILFTHFQSSNFRRNVRFVFSASTFKHVEELGPGKRTSQRSKITEDFLK